MKLEYRIPAELIDFILDVVNTKKYVIIPRTVTIINAYDFRGCSSLTQIHIPKSVTSISARTFRGCSSLTQIQIPDSDIKISEHAFDDNVDIIIATVLSDNVKRYTMQDRDIYRVRY